MADRKNGGNVERTGMRVIGEFMATRSPKERCIKLLEASSGTGRLLWNIVVGGRNGTSYSDGRDAVGG